MSENESSAESVVVETPSGTRSGRAVDATGLADPAEVVAAVRTDEASGGERASGDEDVSDTVSVDCVAPGPVHGHVGFVHPDVALRVRTALAAAARSRGARTGQDDELDEVRDELDDLSIPTGTDTGAARRRLAGTESAVAAGRERVATLRGRIQAGRQAGRDVSDLRGELADATRTLSEQETERAAAEEALERAEARAREARDERERRRRLQDREANLERAARRELVDEYREAYAAAVERVPPGPDGESVAGGQDDGIVAGETADGTVAGGTVDETVAGEAVGESVTGESADGIVAGGSTGETVAGDASGGTRPGDDFGGDDPFDVDPVTAALAVARVAALRAPVVLACDRFDSPVAAADWLDAPVIRV